MALDEIRLKDDTAAAGKRVPARSRVETNTRQWERHHRNPARDVLGDYHSTMVSETGTLHTPPAGHCWLINPVGSGVLMALKEYEIVLLQYVHTSGQLSSRLQAYRVTFTGTASTLNLAFAKRKSTDPTPVGQFIDSNAGLTLTVGAAILGTLVPGRMTAGTSYAAMKPHVDRWAPVDDDEELVLGAGEGVALSYLDTGGASQRRLTVNVTWQEFTDI